MMMKHIKCERARKKKKLDCYWLSKSRVLCDESTKDDYHPHEIEWVLIFMTKYLLTHGAKKKIITFNDKLGNKQLERQFKRHVDYLMNTFADSRYTHHATRYEITFQRLLFVVACVASGDTRKTISRKSVFHDKLIWFGFSFQACLHEEQQKKGEREWNGKK